MKYKGFKIIETNEGFAIIDQKFDQKIKCKNLQACKIRISKLIASRIYFNI
jgi:hypothetical protein